MNTRLLAGVASFLGWTISAGALSADVIFVAAGAAGAEDGTSWTDAFTDLQDALAVAQPDDEIWVAEGTYLPSASGDRDASFVLLDGVALYGGFAGTETLREERDWSLHESVLSGDLSGDDEMGGSNAENSRNVVEAVGVGTTAVLDGFVVERGRNEGRGAGLDVSSADPSLRNCTFRFNFAQSGHGGALALSLSFSVVMDCTFEENGSTTNGGAVFSSGGSTGFERCTFRQNTASTGGAAAVTFGSALFQQCSFEDNTAEASGGGLYNLGGGGTTITAVRCTFFRNSAGAGGGGGGARGVECRSCTFRENVAQRGGGLRDGSAIGCLFVGNTADFGGGSYSVTAASSTYVANAATQTGGGHFANFFGTIGCILRGNSAPESPDLHSPGVPPSYSNVQGGATGTGNIDADPLFADSANGDYHLTQGSPCIDAGTNSVLTGYGPFDCPDGSARRLDDPWTPDTGAGTPPIIDMGAFEFENTCPADADGDLVCDDVDNCLGLANPGQQDADLDGVGDACDDCPSAPDPDQTDSDGDGAGDACDGCPLDPAKIAPGTCGCGVAESDGDLDGVPDCVDNCPLVANASQADCDGDGAGDACELDCDADGVPDDCQTFADCNANGQPDACDPDGDVDGIPDDCDDCPLVADPAQLDSDGDGVGNLCDNCPFTPNPGQEDADGDGRGDVCARWFVDADATGAQDGRSWTDAFTDLQGALAVALPSDEVWVAAGTYRPDPGGIRTRSFALRSGVALYGGFAGGETFLAQRNPAANPSVLSGDLPGAGDSYHVVNGSGTNLSARLDGFVITRGLANGGGSLAYGGGVYVSSGSPTIVGCTLVENTAARGGGLYVLAGAPVLSGCELRDNVATSAGGAGWISGNASFFDCTIAENQAGTGHAGGLYLSGRTLLVRCAVVDNAATASSVGGIYATGGALTILDSTLARNVGSGTASNLGGGSVHARLCVLELAGSTIAENESSFDGGGVAVSSGTARFTDCAFLDNSTSRIGGGLSLLDADTTVERVSFARNEAIAGGALAVRDASPVDDPLVARDCSFSANRASFRGGAARVWGGNHYFEHLSLSGNVAPSGGSAFEHVDGGTTIVSSALWNHAGAALYRFMGSLSVRYTNLQGGYSGPGSTGNSGANPRFVDAANGDLHLLAISPCIDSGADTTASADLDQRRRAFDHPGAANTGTGTRTYVDRGAHEFGSPPACAADCDGDGTCDTDEIAAGAGDLNQDGIPDPCQGVASASGVDPGETVTLYPAGLTDRLRAPVVEFQNVSGPGPGSITVVQSELELEPGASGYAAFGRTLTIETDLPEGAFFLRVSLPFTAADLAGASTLSPDLLYYDAPAFAWALAASANTMPSPMHPGPLGDRTADASPPFPLSPELGDYGVSWDSGAVSGFVWANVDHTTDFRGGIAFGTTADCNQNGQADELDIALGASADCNQNGMPDECELAYGWASDCDASGVLDECEITAAFQQDCNENGIPDACDLASGTSHDVLPIGGDGIPDECQRDRVLRAPR